MKRLIIGALASVLAMPAVAAVQRFPPDFRIENIRTNGTTLHVRIGGHGPQVVLHQTPIRKIIKGDGPAAPF